MYFNLYLIVIFTLFFFINSNEYYKYFKLIKFVNAKICNIQNKTK